ncbi:ABC transporter substrate-binding protein [bacterium]|nr:ABC transporter substrate-binding protein [bacterium]
MAWRSVADDLGRELTLPAPPRRIVSLVPSVTELLCDLGAGARLVGATRFCTEPPDVVARLARLGGTKTADCEALLALQPDLVVMNSEENDRAHFARLVDHGLPVFVSFPTSVEAAGEGILRLGAAIAADAAAAALDERIRRAAAVLRPLLRRRPRVFCPIWRTPWMSFNADTYCHDVLARAGGDNVCARLPARYPTVDLAAIAAADPQVILLPDEPYPFATRHLPDLAALRDTTAWRAGAVHLIDGKALSWYGARTAPALALFFRLLQGDDTPLPDDLACVPARG